MGGGTIMQGDIDKIDRKRLWFFFVCFKVYYQNARRHIAAVTALGLSNFTHLDLIIKVAEPSRLSS